MTVYLLFLLLLHRRVQRTLVTHGRKNESCHKKSCYIVVSFKMHTLNPVKRLSHDSGKVFVVHIDFNADEPDRSQPNASL